MPGPPLSPQPAEPLNSLEQLRVNPWLLGGIYLQYLRSLFGPGRIMDMPEVRGLTWTPGVPGAQFGGIVIEDILRLDASFAGFRPAIFISRDDWYPQAQGINNQNMGSWTTGDGNGHYTTLWVGSHTIHCLSDLDNPDMAEALGAQVAAEFIEFAPVLRQSCGLQRITVGLLSRPHELPANAGYAVSITISSAFTHQWTIRPETPLLAKFTINQVLKSD